jgi:hypothetical protein
MDVKCSISLGELVDKISVLHVKEENIEDENKIANIREEMAILEEVLRELDVDGVGKYIDDLKSINLYLWKIIDEMRIHERDGLFDARFIYLSREVYKNNDKRFLIKNEVNKKYNSLVREEKNI